MKIIRATIAATVVVAAFTALPAGAHERDLITAGGRVGPIRTNTATIAEMKNVFGPPTSRKVVRVGCSRVIRLRWGRQLQTYTYRADEERRIVDVKVLARRVQGTGGSFSFHTGRGLRVGDTERELRRLYPQRRPYTHNAHSHYILGESRRGTRLLAKVVDNRVVQLEAVPYEFC
jgi:hypothetical protein